MFYVFLFQFSNLAFAVGGNLRGEDNEDKTDNQVKTKQNKKLRKMISVLKLSFIFC
jgi:hypothetical protein